MLLNEKLQEVYYSNTGRHSIDVIHNHNGNQSQFFFITELITLQKYTILHYDNWNVLHLLACSKPKLIETYPAIHKHILDFVHRGTFNVRDAYKVWVDIEEHKVAILRDKFELHVYCICITPKPKDSQHTHLPEKLKKKTWTTLQ